MSYEGKEVDHCDQLDIVRNTAPSHDVHILHKVWWSCIEDIALDN